MPTFHEDRDEWDLDAMCPRDVRKALYDNAIADGCKHVVYRHPSAPVAVIARTADATTTNGFTDGREYALVYIMRHGRQGEVRNDNGHLRVVPLDGSKTAHFKDVREHPVGGFDVVYFDGPTREYGELREGRFDCGAGGGVMRTVLDVVAGAYPDANVVERAQSGCRKLGDSLYEFVLVELEDTMADDKDYVAALRALRTARHDLDTLIAALEEEVLQEV